MHHSVTFNFSSAKACSPAIFETCFSYDKDIWIAATDYYVNFYKVVLFPLTAVLQSMKFYSFIIFSILINAVILLLNCLVLILYLYIHFLSLRSYYVHPTVSGVCRPLSHLVSGHFNEKYLSYLYQIWYGCLLG